MGTPIAAGTILIEDGTVTPDSMKLKRDPYSSGWASLTVGYRELEKEVDKAHWNVFYIGSDIKKKAFGFNKSKNLRSAVERVIMAAKANHCNCLEITQITVSSFFNLPYVTVTAHSRHIQEGNMFADVTSPAK